MDVVIQEGNSGINFLIYYFFNFDFLQDFFKVYVFFRG